MDLKGAKLRNVNNLCADIESDGCMPMKINIPCYQRPYSWETKHITNLIIDFQKNKSENQNEEYFIGSVVLVKGAQGTEWQDVIDGQQRLTTIFLLNYLKFITLRAYIEELIGIKKINLAGHLTNLEKCYKYLLGTTKCDSFPKLREDIMEKLDKLNEVQEEDKDEFYSDILKQYQSEVGLPKKDLTDMECYKRSYRTKLYNMLDSDQLVLSYNRSSYNSRLKEALSNIMILVSKDSDPEFVNSYEGEDAVVVQYINAMKTEFEVLKEMIICEEIEPLENAKNMILAIDEMLVNIKFCAIITGNDKDAYTLFEVLNDRALKIVDLDLIKNLYYKEYCTKSGDDDDVIDKNIEMLDKLWGDKIFAPTLKQGHEKLISYLGTVYLTADEELHMNKVEKYREILEDKHLCTFDKTSRKYKYDNVRNDIEVYQMIKLIVDEYKLAINRKPKAAIKAECDIKKSITYKTFHLLNALDLDGVIPALSNIIVKKFRNDYVNNGKQAGINEFKDYINRIADDCGHSVDEFMDIHELAYELWKSALYAKDHKRPRELAKIVIKNVNDSSYAIDNVVISNMLSNQMLKEFDKWTEDWQYSGEKGNLKIKILFIHLFKMNKIGDVLKLQPSIHAFTTDEIQLDHLEADNPSDICLEKYFTPKDPNERREKYVSGLGNFMILDDKNNVFKNNKPLYDALGDYNNMCTKHWLIEEVKELLDSNMYSRTVKIINTDFRVPNEEFFTERRTRLKKYFKAMLKMELKDSDVTL
nr:DUF262 domain-containing protein [Eubacterium sp.]